MAAAASHLILIRCVTVTPAALGRDVAPVRFDATVDTAELIDHLVLAADRVDRGDLALREYVVSVGLAAELCMCAIASAADASPDQLGDIPVGRSSYWRADWPVDVTRSMGRLDPDSREGIQLSNVAAVTLEKFRTTTRSWFSSPEVRR